MKRYFILMLLTLLEAPLWGGLMQNDTLSAEKIYLKTDRDFYFPGETIKVNVNLVSYKGYTPSTLSEVVHLILWNSDHEILVSQRIQLNKASGSSELALQNDLPPDNYLLTAHTNFMLNFGLHNYDKRSIKLLSKEGNVDATNEPLVLKAFPEGGQILADQRNRVAFQFKQLEYSSEGYIIDQTGDSVARFSLGQNGYGVADFLAYKANSYTAIININDQVKSVHLGQPEEHTASIRLDNPLSDSLAVIVNFGRQYIESSFSILVQNKGEVILGTDLVRTGLQSRFIIPRELLGSGLNQLMILNESGEVISERLVYKRLTNSIEVSPMFNYSSVAPRSEYTLPVRFNSISGSANLHISVKSHDFFDAGAEKEIEYQLNLFSEINFQPPSAQFNKWLEDDEFMNQFLLTKKLSRFRIDSHGITDKIYPIEKKSAIPIFGVVKNKETGNPIAKASILCSVTGENPQLYHSLTDDNGNFTFYVFPFEGKNNVILKLSNNDEKKSNIEYQLERSLPKIDAEDFNTYLSIDTSKVRNYLRLLHENETIERVYAPKINKEAALSGKINQFFESYTFSIDLTEYITLDSFKEIIRELVPGIDFGKRGNDLKLRFYNYLDQKYLQTFEKRPLILVDGLPINDIDLIFELPPNELKNIGVINNMFYIGEKSFEGVLEITTMAGDYYYKNDTNHLNSEMIGIYQANNGSKINLLKELPLPDLRPLLFWKPEINLSPGQIFDIQLNTSDLLGTYTLEIQGIDESGNTIYFTKTISVDN